MEIMSARVEDAEAILALQRLAYQTEAATYDDFTIPPLTDTLENLQSRFGDRRFLKAVDGGQIVGSVRAFQKEATCYVERLIVHPDFRCRGIGTALLTRIEALFPQIRRFELFTGHKSAANIRLYERLGYRAFREEQVNEKVTLAFMEKARTGAMSISARFVHTNIVAHDWRRLSAFYQQVFGCVSVSPERHLTGREIEAATGVPGAEIDGVHLRLPGYGEGGPTLEIFQYNQEASGQRPTINRPGFAHIAFAVDEVQAARDAVIAAGGGTVGELVSLDVPDAGRVTFYYVHDPEGNFIELQKWSR